MPPQEPWDPAEPDILRAAALPASPEEAGEAIPAFADGAFMRLHPNQIIVDRIGSLIFAGVVAAGVLVVFLMLLLSRGIAATLPWVALGVGMGSALLLTVLGIVMPRLSYNATSYAISPLGLEIRRGIWWKHVIDVPRSRVQHTDVQQGPLMRSFGLGKLVVYTAGTRHASVELEGLEHGRALEMRDFLLRGGGDDDAT